MHPLQPIATQHLFAPLHAELVALLRGLDRDEWSAPTVAGSWSVKDVAAHLLDTSLRRLSMHRDGYTPPLAPSDSLAAFVNGMNAEGVSYARRLSPEVLVDLIDRAGAEMAAFFESLDPRADAKWNVSWAGEERSPMWFDIARELTERWHHQQQIRTATGRPPLYAKYLGPVIATFVRALPYAYRDVEAAEGTAIVVTIDETEWTLVRERQWVLYSGRPENAVTRVTMAGDRAWRIFTRQKIDPEAIVEGNVALAQPLFGMVAII